MEKSEFIDLLEQMIDAAQPGNKIRLTLLRTPDNFFSGKIAGDQYVNLRSIPIVEKYRVVISNFNASEYKRFKELFNDEVQFMSFGRDQLEGIVSTANQSGYYLCGFKSTGQGTISLRAAPDRTGQNYLLNEIRNGIINGIYPSMYRLSDGSHLIEFRDDFNIILSTEKKPDLSPIFDLFTGLIIKLRDLHDRVMSQIYPYSGTAPGLPSLTGISFRRIQGISDNLVHESACRKFTPGLLEDCPVGKAFYVFEKTYSSPFCRVTLTRDLITVISMPRASMSSVLRVIDNISAVTAVVANAI